MKLLLNLTILFFITITANAQKDVTTFLGIPVDGTKESMTKQLEAKGFIFDQSSNQFMGVIAERKVTLRLGLRNDRVWRIMAADAVKYDEFTIKKRFNELCEYFMNNNLYTYERDFTLPENEDISVGLLKVGKQYKAQFFQKPTEIDPTEYKIELNKELSRWFTKEQLENQTTEVAAEIQKITNNWKREQAQKKCVWFMITDHNGEYCLYLFYDNRYNYNSSDLF